MIAIKVTKSNCCHIKDSSSNLVLSSVLEGLGMETTLLELGKGHNWTLNAHFTALFIYIGKIN